MILSHFFNFTVFFFFPSGGLRLRKNGEPRGSRAESRPLLFPFPPVSGCFEGKLDSNVIGFKFVPPKKLLVVL